MFLHSDSDTPALIETGTGRVVTHRRLAALAADRALAVPGLVFLFADATVETVVDYVAALHRGAPVALLDPALHPEQAETLVARYRPALVVNPPSACRMPGYYLAAAGRYWLAGEPRTPVVHPDLAVLLTTSGSTGSPKLVRLSRSNIAANTEAIIASLGITPADRAITTLPLHYSFGMSVLNTHLAAGGTLVITRATVLEPDFWAAVREHGPTSLSGVPYTFHMLRRLGFDQLDLPSVRMLTQAGGRLEPAVVSWFHEVMAARGGAFHVMYGQTEAAPRMTCLPASALPAKLGSAGLPMPGGHIEICDGGGRPLPAGETGHVVYRGPNVMMGYAEDAADLALGDLHGDRLETGDLGWLDPEGYLFLSGRTKRIGKVYGTRISLDEVEQMLQAQGPVAVVAEPDTLVVHCESPDVDGFADQRRRLAHDLRVPVSAVRFRLTDPLPRTPNGKIDYRSLEARGKRSA